MHFQTLVLAGLTSLAAVAGLPSGSRSAHDGHLMARHHRFIRPRKANAEPISSKKRCPRATSTSSADPEEPTEATPEPTDVEVGALAAKPTPTSRTKSAKFTTSTVSKKGSATETSSTGKAAPTAGTGGIVIGDKLLATFPGGTEAGMSRWSTNPAVPGALTLNDATLRAEKKNTKLAHPTVAMLGKQAMKVSFGKGSYAYRGPPGGVSLYALGPANQPIDNAKVLTFSYSVLFEKGFQFVKGGKLPGLYGGTNDEEATGCSGGRGRATCWSLRYMWRTAGAGELYAYLPTDANTVNKAAACHEGGKKNTSCDLDYGWSLGRGTWKWNPGSWQTIAQKITLNDIGKANGSVETYLDGRKVHTVDGIMIRTRKNAMPRGAMIQSFFGGHDPSWAPSQDQNAYFADFSLAVLETE
ncbi:hypothetical protein FRC07_002789 [Ceratobasidium sp. 392]|nr:hypothetical protein FRC07_002789 [Ceratobasidium sp. 392]